MSSLGDLLLGKIPEPVDVVEKNDEQTYDDNDNNHKQADIKPDSFKQTPSSDLSNDATNGQYGSGGQKIFLERIEKKRPETMEDDRRSNASSTDDLVRELLDPNDRPRNVWHVVAEGEEQKSPVRQHDDQSSRDVNSAMERREPSEEDLESSSRNNHEIYRQASPERDATEPDKTEDRERDRGRHGGDARVSSDRDRHDKKRPRDHDKERDRERELRRRSPDRHSKSRSKRSKYSDDEDDDRDYKRHRGSRSRRHDRRSRSRSPSRDSGSRRRRHRSRSADSRSPVTKRNSKTILVMQLSPRVVSRDLEDFFEVVGRVKEVRLIMDSKTRRHKGIAYIEFESASSATKALALDGQMFHDAPLQIQSALTEKSRGSSDQHSGPSSSSSYNNRQHSTSHAPSSHYSSSRFLLPPNSYRVYMGGLNVGITEDMLRTIVEPFGLVHKVEIIKDRTTGLSRGYGFVTFASMEDGQEAIRNLDGFELAGKSLRVSKSTEKGDR